jgi:hypothetical protein
MTDRSKWRVGVYVRHTLLQLFRDRSVSRSEVALMQTAAYSRHAFGLSYPLLLKVDSPDAPREIRYWAGPVEIYGSYYLICCEWYEKPFNNDRRLFDAWLAQRSRLRQKVSNRSSD